jgi:DNA-binding FrmR family transcriptional regulator
MPKPIFIEQLMNGATPITNDSSPVSEPGEHIHNHSHTDHTHIDSVHPHVHSEESLRRIINRLSRIEGHVRGIKTMVQQNTPCPDVLLQIAAVRGALDKVARIVLDEHLTECIGRAAQAGNIESEIEQLKAALDRFLP